MSDDTTANTSATADATGDSTVNAGSTTTSTDSAAAGTDSTTTTANATTANTSATADAEVVVPVKRRVRRQTDVTTVDPLTEISATRGVVTDTFVDALPIEATLAAPFAFYDDDGTYHSWAAGQVLSDATQIGALVDHGAIFTAS